MAALALLMPALVATEFKPWIFFDPDNLKVSLRFFVDFFPPALGSEFLLLVVKETWRTVAIATAGLTLAMI
jgi:phosphonate transport system permease protein